MLLPIKWLNDYVDIDMDMRTLSDKITDSGSHVEQIIDRSKGLSGVSVGKILKIDRHPNADKLVVCKVDMGDEELTIVTGAPNVFEGAVLPIARVGAKLPNGMEIEPTDFRGVVSYGMMCSYEELGFDHSVIPVKFRDGVLILDENTPLGADIAEVLDMNWDVFECEITPNRPDCLSIIGMARETAASFDKGLVEAEINIPETEGDIKDYLNNISIETEDCRRFYSRVLKDVKIAPSPQWLQNNLMAAGVRPINNIVDLTNYVMLEYGQPLHAYDIEDIRGHEIKVLKAEEGEEFKTLDGQVRKLKAEDIIIADGEGTIGIAGVMGGEDSGVKDDSTTIVLEGANFFAPSVRHTSKRLGLRTEASSRFEKGLDPENAKLAVDRVCELALEIGAAKVVGGSIDVYKDKAEKRTVLLRPERVTKLLGIELPKADIKSYLERLEIEVNEVDGKFSCIIPSFRGDITIEADLIEEVARLYGMNNIKPEPIYSEMTRGELPYYKIISRKLKAALKGMGYSELLTYSFMSPRIFDKLNLPEDDERRDAVKLLNPLGEEFSVMRTTLIGSVLDIASRNQNRNIKNMLMYEIGNTFTKKVDKDNLPSESQNLVLAGFGDIDFYYIKESLEHALESVGISNLEFKRVTDNGLFHPGRCASVYHDGEYLGIMGEIHPEVMDRFEIRERTLVGEFDFEKIVEKSTTDRTYKALPKYPSSSRDLAIILDKDILMSEVKAICESVSEDLLEDFTIFDIYTGEQIADDKKSVAFSLRFRSLEKTLKDKDVNIVIDKIVKELKDKLGAELRD